MSARGVTRSSPAAGWDELWLTYNRALLAEHRRHPFPVIDFDRHADLDSQVRAALAFHDLEPWRESGFFERELVGPSVDDWRSQVGSTEALELWETLAALAGALRRRAAGIGILALMAVSQRIPSSGARAHRLGVRAHRRAARA